MLVELRNGELFLAWVLIFVVSIVTWETLYPPELKRRFERNFNILDSYAYWVDPKKTQEIEEVILKHYNVEKLLVSQLRNRLRAFKEHKTKWIDEVIQKKPCNKIKTFEEPNYDSLPIKQNSKTDNEAYRGYVNITELIFENQLKNIPTTNDKLLSDFRAWGTRLITCDLFFYFNKYAKVEFIDANRKQKIATELPSPVPRNPNRNDPLLEYFEQIKPQLIYLIIGSDSRADSAKYPALSPYNHNLSKYPHKTRIQWGFAKDNTDRCMLTKAYEDRASRGIVRTLSCGLGKFGKISESDSTYGHRMDHDGYLYANYFIDFVLENKNTLSVQFVDKLRSISNRWINIEGENENVRTYRIPQNLNDLYNNIINNRVLHSVILVAMVLAFITSKRKRILITKVDNEILFWDAQTQENVIKQTTTANFKATICNMIGFETSKSLVQENTIKAHTKIYISNRGEYDVLCTIQICLIIELIGIMIMLSNPFRTERYKALVKFNKHTEPKIDSEDIDRIEEFRELIERQFGFPKLIDRRVIWDKSSRSYKRLVKSESKFMKKVYNGDYGIIKDVRPGLINAKIKMKDLPLLYNNKDICVVMWLLDLEGIIEHDLQQFLEVLKSKNPSTVRRYVLAPTEKEWEEFSAKHKDNLKKIREVCDENTGLNTIMVKTEECRRLISNIGLTHFALIQGELVLEIEGISVVENIYRPYTKKGRTQEKELWVRVRTRMADIGFYSIILSQLESDNVIQLK